MIVEETISEEEMALLDELEKQVSQSNSNRDYGSSVINSNCNSNNKSNTKNNNNTYAVNNDSKYAVTERFMNSQENFSSNQYLLNSSYSTNSSNSHFDDYSGSISSNNRALSAPQGVSICADSISEEDMAAAWDYLESAAVQQSQCFRNDGCRDV